MVETTDRRTPHLMPADVRALLRLSNQLHQSPVDPVVRKRALLEGLCRLVDATEGSASVTTLDRLTARRIVISVVRIVPDLAESAVPSSALTDKAPRTSRARLGADTPRELADDASGLRGSNVGSPDLRHCIDSYVGLVGMQVVASITLCRPTSHRPFTSRHREIVNCMHSEMAWIYGHDLFLTSPEATALPDRQRQTLQYLVAGEPEAQIAAKVELSPTTVHGYVRSLYRRFSVTSRSELLSKWAERRRQDC